MTEEEKKVAPGKELDDDFDQSEETEKRQAWKTFDRYASNFYKAGFREAVIAETGDEKSILQEAFDSGYSTAFVVSRIFGKLRGTLALTVGIYEEGRLSCTPEQLEGIKSLYEELTDAQNNFVKYVDDQNLFAETDSLLVAGSFSSVEDLNSYWTGKVRSIFDLEDFDKRLRAMLTEINCPWAI